MTTWTIGTVVQWATDDFRAKGIESPRLDAEVLLSFALGVTRTQLIIDWQKPLAADELSRFRDLVKRRRTLEPVAYITGQREFYGRAFRVDRRVLVPRPDTEVLVDVALARSAHVSMSMRALDLCTGSGCVAISLARERPTGFVTAVDLSEDALAVARENAQRLGAYNTSFRAGDLFEPLDRTLRFDVITANPPYIAEAEMSALSPGIREHEPLVALAGGVDGLAVVRKIVEGARPFLAAGGALAVEVGAGQAPAVEALFASAGFEDVRRALDYARIERVVSGIVH